MSVTNLSEKRKEKTIATDNQFMAERHLRLAQELENDISDLEKKQVKYIVESIDARHIAGQIQILEVAINRHKDLANKYQGGEL